MYSQVDTEGNEFILLQEICDHWKDGLAVAKDNMFVAHTRGSSNAVHRRTTKGWQLLVQWKDGSTSWTPLKDLKESNPVEVAEYAVANKIANKPAFIWWARDVLRKCDRMIAKVRSHYWKRTHKFGVLIPKSVKEALILDDKTGTDLWQKAIEKEMKNVMPAFTFLEQDDKVPIGYQHIDCHMIFDVKMDFTRKA